MTPLRLPLSYLIWHYTVAWRDLARLYRNFAWFLWNFFSIRLLAGTLFSPWKRLHEASNKSTGGFLGSFILNTLMRFIGLFARLFTILTGCASLLLLSLGFVAFLLLWLFLPALVFIFLVSGFVIISSF